MTIISRPGEPNLHYEMDDFTDPWKDAPFILLQHGYGRSSEFWYRWVPYLGRHFKVIRPDLRGLGRSSTDFDLSTGINADAYLADLDAVIDHAGAANVHYVGESLGGILGLIYAATRPARIRTLSIVSTPAFLNQDLVNRSRFGYASWEEALRKMGARGYAEAKNKSDRFAPGTDAGLAEWFADRQGRSDVEVLIAMQKVAPTMDAQPYLDRIEAPTLAIWPSDGPIVTTDQKRILRAGIASLTVTEITTSHHNLHCTQAAACARQVLAFAALRDGLLLSE